MDLRLKYLSQDIDRHGNVRVYVRRHGRKVRLRSAPGSPEFMREYEDALAGIAVTAEPATAAPRTTLKWLVSAYYQSAEFRRLADSTRKARRGILDGLCEKYRSKPFARMEARHVRKLRDEKANLPEAANGRLKALRQVFGWAVEAQIADTNPAREVPNIRNQTDGFHTWTESEVLQFEQMHPIGTKARLALALLLYTGVRRSDAVGLGRQMENDGWLRFTETKGRSLKVKQQELPILPVLRNVLDATPSGHLTYLVTTYGKPFTSNGFGNWFRKRCDEAGLPYCTAHGLRKAGATIAANNGATEHQLMAIYGWNSPKQAATYTRRANRKRLAKDAMHLLVSEQDANESVPPLAKK